MRTVSTRSLAFAALNAGAALALLAANQQAAWSSDTLWDLLRKGDPAKPRTTPVSAIRDPHAGMHMQKDPKTGQMMWVRDKVKKHERGVLGIVDNVGEDLQELGKKFNSSITLHGDKQMGLHLEHVSGNSQSYGDENYFGSRGVGGTYNQTDLLIQGKIEGVLNFEQHYTDNQYANPNDNRISLNYATRRFKFDAGDIQAGIAGNSLVAFSRALKGVQVSAEVLRGFRLTTLYSQTRATSRTITLQGNGRSDGYYVYAGQIVDGSEQVRVNNQPMVKGTDYQLDPTTGELKFLNGRIVSPTDVIAVSFEVYGDGTSAGTITGFRGETTAIKHVTLGFTTLSEATPSAGVARQRTEQFPGAQLDIYSLLYPVDIVVSTDATGKPFATPRVPMNVTVDGRPLVYGVDYVVNPVIPNEVIFRQPEPSTSVVLIAYTPALSAEQAGNRSVSGIDAGLSLGKLGTISAEMANSSLDLVTHKVNGSAMQLRGDMHFFGDKLDWNWNYHSIGNNFSPIESPGFNVNETGITTGLNYNASRDLKFNFSLTNSKRPDYNYAATSSTDGIAPVDGTDNYTQMTLGATYRLGKTGNLALTHNSMDTTFGAGGKSTFSTDSLNLDYGFRKFKVGFALGRNVSDSVYAITTSTSTSGTGTTGTQLTDTNTTSLSQRVNLTWNTSDRLNFMVALSNNSLTGYGSGTTDSRDIQFTSNITPMKNMRLTLGYQLQNSGGNSTITPSGVATTPVAGKGLSLSALRQAQMWAFTRDVTPGAPSFNPNYGSTGAYGVGGQTNYYGGGVNAGLGNYGNYSGGLTSGLGTYGTGSFGGNSNSFMLTWSYQPRPSLNLSTNLNQSYSNGDYLLNSNSTTMAFVVGFTPNQRFGFNTNVSLQRMTYVGSSGGTNTGSYGFNVHTKPFGKLTADFNYMSMRSGSQSASSTTGTTGSTGSTTGATGGSTSTGVPGVNTGVPGVGGINPITGLPIGGGLTGGYVPSFGAFSTNMNSYGVRLEYPVWHGNSLYVTLDNTGTTGTGAAELRTITFGISFDLGNHRTFNLGWRDQSNISRDPSVGTGYNYHVSSLDANFGLHF